MSQYFNLPVAVEGEEFTTDHVNLPNQALEQLKILPGSGSGAVGVNSGPAGVSLRPPAPMLALWVRITGKGTAAAGGSTPYAWRELIPAGGGKWIDGPRKGPAVATPGMQGAFEVNGSTTVPTGTDGSGPTPSSGGAIVKLQFDEHCNCMMFQYGACS